MYKIEQEFYSKLYIPYSFIIINIIIIGNRIMCITNCNISIHLAGGSVRESDNSRIIDNTHTRVNFLDVIILILC